MEQARRQFGVATTYTDYRQMLAEANLDAVFVLTPPNALFSITRDCLAAGIPTLLEKPPGLLTTETRELALMARQHGTYGMVG